MTLSERLQPGMGVEQWLIEEVKRLEAELAEFRKDNRVLRVMCVEAIDNARRAHTEAEVQELLNLTNQYPGSTELNVEAIEGIIRRVLGVPK